MSNRYAAWCYKVTNMWTRLLQIALLTLPSGAIAETINVRYRDQPIDTETASIVEYDVQNENSFVKRVFHDELHDYLVLELQVSWSRTVNYHYCGVTGSNARSLAINSMPGIFYHYEIKGKHDCRAGGVPTY